MKVYSQSWGLALPPKMLSLTKCTYKTEGQLEEGTKQSDTLDMK